MLLFANRNITEEDLTDLHGKVAIVTGGNAGIGYATIQFLARKGAKVYMAARNQSKAEIAIEQLKSEGIADGSVHWLELNLSEPALAKKAADDFLSKESRLDILVNNAASGAQEPVSLDQYGIPNMFIVNCISPYLFTRTLIPILTSTSKIDKSDVRIVNLSSGLHARSHPESLVGKTSISGASDTVWDVARRLKFYAFCKLVVLLHIKQLQRIFAADSINITCMAVNPGAINTPGSASFLASVPYAAPFLKLLSRCLFGTWRDGAMTVAWAAAGRDVNMSREHYYGRHVGPVAYVTSPSRDADDERLAREIWETNEAILAEMGH